MFKMSLPSGQQHGNTEEYFTWFSLDQTQIYKIVCPVSRKQKRFWPLSFLSPQGAVILFVCVSILPYKLGAKCSKVTPVEKGDKEKWIQTSCYTSFLTWFRSCNGAREAPEWTRLEFQLILYLVTTGVSHQLVQRKMRWFKYMDLKILILKNKVVHFPGFSWAGCTTCFFLRPAHLPLWFFLRDATEQGWSCCYSFCSPT